jgi:hypothetical protein
MSTQAWIRYFGAGMVIGPVVAVFGVVTGQIALVACGLSVLLIGVGMRRRYTEIARQQDEEQGSLS